jgi:predicted aldo/keto reductase-like oxidoreductase
MSQNAIDRRRFLKLGAAATGLAVTACGTGEEPAATNQKSVMRYRPLGKTGLTVSELSFGGDGPDNPALVLAALDAGINTIITSADYRDGRAQEAIGEAIQSMGRRRDELVLFTGLAIRPGRSKRDVLEAIDGSLRRLRTDHVEIFCSYGVRSHRDLRRDAVFEAFEEAKRAGKVSHLALSGHSGGMQEFLESAIDSGRFDVFFIKYDFASYPDQDDILRRATQQGTGTIVFKTNAGNRQREIKDLEAGGLSFPQATVKWALTNPDVASVCIRFTNFRQIRDYTAAVGTTLAASEVSMLRRYTAEMYDQYCRFCARCEAHCPNEVAVADVMRYAMYFKYYGREKDSMQLYGALPARFSAAACARCPGSCEAGCPFGRRVRAELVEAHRLLSFSRA